MLSLAATLGLGLVAGGAMAIPKALRAFGLGGGGLLKGAVKHGARGIATGIKYAAKGATNKNVWGALSGKRVLAGVNEGSGALSRYHGLLGGAARFGGLYGAAKGIDTFRESPYAQDLSGGQRALLGMASFGLKFSGARHLVRGGMGSAFSAAERVTGRSFYARQFSGKFTKALNPLTSYESMNSLMGGMFTRGSAVNWAARKVGDAALGAAKIPFRMALGMPFALRSGVQMAGRMAGVGHTPFSQILSPRLPFGHGNKFAQFLTNKELEAPIGHAMFGLSATAGLVAHAASYNHNAGQNWSPATRDTNYFPSVPFGVGGAARGRVPAFDPTNYAGFQRRGMKDHNPMAVENLTLGLHKNNAPMMPR